MADISKLTALDGITYDLKDAALRERCESWPIASRTYENVIATANDAAGAGFFYLKVRGATYDDVWRVKVAVHAVVPSNTSYNTHTVYELWGGGNAALRYSCSNTIFNVSYKPIGYNCCFLVSQDGYENGCGSWIGFSLYGSTNPTKANLSRSVTVELLNYENCTVELQDALITPADIPDLSEHADWYASTSSDYKTHSASIQGYVATREDTDTVNISNLRFGNGAYIADSKVYRYQMLFQVDENTLTPLNNVNNNTGTGKAMLTSRTFDPFGRILYYGTSTSKAAGENLGGSTFYYGHAGIDLRYTFNCGSTLTASRPFYLVTVPQADGSCVIDGAAPWSQTLPATNDGKWYILLGRMYSGYQMALYPYHPVFYHDGTAVRRAWPQQPNSAITNAEIDAILAG